MAALTKAGVTIEDFWTEGATNGKYFKGVRAKLVLSSQGGATNNIPASLFGMKKITEVYPGAKDDSTRQEFFPSYDGTLLIANTAGSYAAADITGTFRVTIVGKT